MLLANFAEAVRGMTVGETLARARRSPVSAWRQTADEDGRSFNAYVTKLRSSTGFGLQVETLPPHLSGSDVVRCYTVTRVS